MKKSRRWKRQLGIIHEVLAELVDVLYLTLNLGQECGLEQCLEPRS